MNTTFKLWNRNKSNQSKTGPIVTDVGAVSPSQTLNLRKLKTPADDFHERMPQKESVARPASDPMITQAIEESGTYDDVEFYETATELNSFTQVRRNRFTNIERVIRQVYNSLETMLSARLTSRTFVIAVAVTVGALVLANYITWGLGI